MKYFIHLFLKYRDSTALAIFLTGVPFVYFLRDGLNLAPNNAIFSMVLIFFPFALALVLKNFKFFDAPNRVTYPLLWWFVFFLFAYFFLKDRYYSTVNYTTEYLNYILIFFVGVSVIFFRKESMGKSFIYISIFFAVISAIALIIYISMNPLYAFGQRASFGYGGEVGVGNPHINSKVAFFGVILGFLSLKYREVIKLGLVFPVFIILINVVVLFLTQTALAFLATFIFLFLFFLINFSLNSTIHFFKELFSKWYVLLILVLSIVAISYQIEKNQNIIDPIFNYVNVRIEGIKNSFIEKESKKNIKIGETGDDSANMRIGLAKGVVERIDKNSEKGDYHKLLFGNGYKHMYVDIPHLEMLDSFGLVGFLFFTLLFFRMIIMCFREMKDPESMGTEFLAYTFIYFLLSNFTAGQMLDYTRFASFFIFARFLKK